VHASLFNTQLTQLLCLDNALRGISSSITFPRYRHAGNSVIDAEEYPLHIREETFLDTFFPCSLLEFEPATNADRQKGFSFSEQLEPA
jgi:hypothetical protein